MGASEILVGFWWVFGGFLVDWLVRVGLVGWGGTFWLGWDFLVGVGFFGWGGMG